MLFAHDTETALQAATALINTDRSGGDALADLDALDRFVEEWRWSGSRRRDAAELAAVRQH
jgi:hypothetical protein